jgi:hypothetical protein
MILFRFHSEFGVDRIDGRLDTLRDLLHVHVGMSPDQAMELAYQEILLSVGSWTKESNPKWTLMAGYRHIFVDYHGGNCFL